MSTGVDVEISPRGIATILLNRPDRSNAIDQRVLDDLAQHFAEMAADDRIRIVLLRGAGKHFCSGADLVARASSPEPPAGATSIVDMLAALDRLPRPTIAVVHGAAIGGGAAIAACCDVVVAAESAFFSIPEVRVGMPPLGVTPFVIRAIGHRSFRRYGLSGERFSAAEALRVGLVHEVVASDKLEQKVAEIVDAMLHGAPNAQRTLKDGMEASISPTVAEIMAHKASHGSPRTAEAVEGTSSFKEKRKPSWYPK